MKKIISLIIAMSLFTTVCFGATVKDDLTRVENDIRIIIERLVSGRQNIDSSETLKQIKFDTTVLDSAINTALRDYKASQDASKKNTQLTYLIGASTLLASLSSLQKYVEDGNIDNLIRGISEYSFGKNTLSQIK